MLPSNVDTNETEGSLVLATLQGALVALNSDQESVVLETEAGNVSVVKLSSSSVDPSSSLVFQFGDSGDQTSDGTITVSVPVSVVSQFEQGGNVMLAVLQVKQDVTDSLNQGDAKVILGAPVLEISFVQEKNGEVSVANVSDLAEPVIFRLQDSSPGVGDCVFFDLDTNSWSTQGVSVASSSQIAQVTGELSNGTWCAAVHFSLFSFVQTIPFDEIIDTKDYVVSQENYMIAIALMLVVFVLVCGLCCTWSFFRVRAPNSGKTNIKDDRGRSHVVKFTRSEVVARDEMVSPAQTARSGRSGRSDKEKNTKVLVTWEVEPAEVLANLDHMKGHGYVAMDVDVAVGPRVSQKKSLKDLRSKSKEFATVSQELRKASQEDDRLEERLGTKMDEEEALDGDIVEVSLDQLTQARVCELYQDRAPVNYWSATHEMLMQAFVCGAATWDESNEPHYDVLVGPRKQRREQVSCRLLSPAFKDGETVFYDEGDREKRRWRKALVAQVVHAKAIVQVHDMEPEPVDLEQSLTTSSALQKRNTPKTKDVPFNRVCRRFVTGRTVLVYTGVEEGWQPAIVKQVEDFSDEFSPRDLTTIEVTPAAGGDSVPVQTCFVQNTEDDEDDDAFSC